MLPSVVVVVVASGVVVFSGVDGCGVVVTSEARHHKRTEEVALISL